MDLLPWLSVLLGLPPWLLLPVCSVSCSFSLLPWAHVSPSSLLTQSWSWEERVFSAVYRWHLMNLILAKFCTVQTHFPCHHLDECEWQNCRVWIRSHRGSWACPLWPCIRTKPSPEESRPPDSQPDWLLMGQDMLSNPEKSIWHDWRRSQFLSTRPGGGGGHLLEELEAGREPDRPPEAVRLVQK